MLRQQRRREVFGACGICRRELCDLTKIEGLEEKSTTLAMASTPHFMP
jgi:hypothetical protein